MIDSIIFLVCMIGVVVTIISDLRCKNVKDNGRAFLIFRSNDKFEAKPVFGKKRRGARGRRRQSDSEGDGTETGQED